MEFGEIKVSWSRMAQRKKMTRNIGILSLVEAMRQDIKTRSVGQAREAINLLLPEEHCKEMQKLPVIIPALYQKGIGTEQTLHYNGIVLLEVNGLQDADVAARVRGEAAALPQTLLAYVGASGKSVKIWVCFRRQDGSLPPTLEQAAVFHAHAYLKAIAVYQPSLSFPITAKSPDTGRGVRLSLDPQAYCNAGFVPICMAQPLGMPDDKAFFSADQIQTSINDSKPGKEMSRKMSLLFDKAMRQAYAEMENYETAEDEDLFFRRLAQKCLKAGIPEEEAVKRTLIFFDKDCSMPVVRSLFQVAYSVKKGRIVCPVFSDDQFLVYQIHEFMNRHYRLRFNEMTNMLEYQERFSKIEHFSELDDRKQNSMAQEALIEGIRLWDRDLNRYLHSDAVPKFQPLEKYLSDLPEWDGHDYIRELAQRVPCDNLHWPDLFYRWFLSMTAHWFGMGGKHANATSPLLVGPQGCRKSTFCQMLIPNELQKYYTDSIDFSSKRDAEMQLNRFALINVDEFDQIRSSQQGSLKHILQKSVVNVRRPHAVATKQLRRYASFIGTSNHEDLLSDPSGSRRFIVISVTGIIDCSQVKYVQLYAQALNKILNGARYWLNDEEEAFLVVNNEKHQIYTIAEQLLMKYLSPAESTDPTLEKMLSIDVLNYLHDKNKMLKLDQCSNIQFGRILKRNKFHSVHSASGRFYYVKKNEEQ